MPAQGEVSIAIRPHALELRGPQDAPQPSHARIAASISEREFLGEFTRYHLKAGDTDLRADLPHRQGDSGFAVGAKVMAGIDPVQVRVFAD